MYLISGCPRSGTSLMMDLMRTVFGEDRIIGNKFPQEDRIQVMQEKQEDETEIEFAVRQYISSKMRDLEQVKRELEETKDMNPNGFWECGWSVQGIQWSLFQHEIIKEAIENKSIVKVVSQGLPSTHPDFVSKIVYMLRHPRAVAKSQERLKGQFGPLEAPQINGEDVKKHSPEMFIRTSKMAARWLKKFNKPFIIVNFDDLIEDPITQLNRIQEFLGEGDFSKVADVINPKLRRSYPQEIENPLWESAEAIYEAMAKQDFEAVEKVEVPRDENEVIVCTRMKRRVVTNECKMCISDPVTRKNFAKTAMDQKVDWEKEPCIYECLAEEISIEESIKNNSWYCDEICELMG